MQASSSANTVYSRWKVDSLSVNIRPLFLPACLSLDSLTFTITVLTSLSRHVGSNMCRLLTFRAMPSIATMPTSRLCRTSPKPHTHLYLYPVPRYSFVLNLTKGQLVPCLTMYCQSSGGCLDLGGDKNLWQKLNLRLNSFIRVIVPTVHWISVVHWSSLGF